MKQLIVEKLREIEKTENVRILLAVESGSRAWGFASPDSDYDARFIYVRPQSEYLRLKACRDVIELPIEGELDINGWDVQKALRLMHRSNPSLLEWLHSPILYLETDEAELLRRTADMYFSEKRSLYHYASMALNNYRYYLKGETVRAKKYFYVLRPVLACRWILDRHTVPPVPFDELLRAELPAELAGDVERLLDIKINSPEVRDIPRIDRLNEYLDASIAEIFAAANSMEAAPDVGWDALDRLFASVAI